MNTNIITFKHHYLISFLKYQLENNTKLSHFFLEWLKLNLSSPPDYYNIHASKALSKNQIIISINDVYIEKNNYLSLTNQKKFEKLVAQSFDVIFFNNLILNHYKNVTETMIYEQMEVYKLDDDLFYMLKKKYWRLRNDYKNRRK